MDQDPKTQDSRTRSRTEDLESRTLDPGAEICDQGLDFILDTVSKFPARMEFSSYGNSHYKLLVTFLNKIFTFLFFFICFDSMNLRADSSLAKQIYN